MKELTAKSQSQFFGKDICNWSVYVVILWWADESCWSLSRTASYPKAGEDEVDEMGLAWADIEHHTETYKRPLTRACFPPKKTEFFFTVEWVNSMPNQVRVIKEKLVYPQYVS